jgi:hypothetical protein
VADRVLINPKPWALVFWQIVSVAPFKVDARLNPYAILGKFNGQKGVRVG